MKRKKRQSLMNMMGAQQSSPRTKAGAKWLSKVKKGQVAPKGLQIAHELFSKITTTKNKLNINFIFISFSILFSI